MVAYAVLAIVFYNKEGWFQFVCVYDNLSLIKAMIRVAQSAGIGGLDPSIAKDLIDSEDPKHTLFCREIAFVAIYALFRDDISILW